MKSEKLSTLQKVTILIGLIVWTVFLWQAIHRFGPTMYLNHIAYNSDNAIPVIMANENRPFTLFATYYYGQDRWGAWPMLMLRFFHWLFAYHWTPQAVFIVQAIWVFIGGLVFAALARNDWLAAGLIFIFVVCLHRQAEYELFELGQLYAWQVTALIVAWFLLRKLLERSTKAAEPLFTLPTIGSSRSVGRSERMFDTAARTSFNASNRFFSR